MYTIAEKENGFNFYNCYNHLDYAAAVFSLCKAGVSLEHMECHRSGHLYQIKVNRVNIPGAIEAYDKGIIVPKELQAEEKVGNKVEFDITLLPYMSVDSIKDKAHDLGIDLDGRIRRKEQLVEDFTEKYKAQYGTDA